MIVLVTQHERQQTSTRVHSETRHHHGLATVQSAARCSVRLASVTHCSCAARTQAFLVMLMSAISSKLSLVADSTSENNLQPHHDLSSTFLFCSGCSSPLHASVQHHCSPAASTTAGRCSRRTPPTSCLLPSLLLMLPTHISHTDPPQQNVSLYNPHFSAVG